MSEQTPMMIQYLSIKEKYRDAVLFFRLGDFYEMFNEDAKEVSSLLNLTLTHRGGNPMCGIPFHASRIYIARLLRAGKKIAICEQVSLPSSGKGIVERKVVEVITPGTVLEEEYLDQNISNYLACLSYSQKGMSISLAFSYIDVSTGEFYATSFHEKTALEDIRKEIGRIQPRELLVQQSIHTIAPEIRTVFHDYSQMVVNYYPDWAFNSETAYKRLCTLFGVTSLQSFSLDKTSAELPCAGLIAEYIESTSGIGVKHISGISIYTQNDFLSIDDSTRKNLELVQNLRDGSSAYSLLHVLDYTKTSMGGRKLRRWIVHPLVDVTEIIKRQNCVSALYHNQKKMSLLRDSLSHILDIERLSSRIALERAHGRDILSLKHSLNNFIKSIEIISDMSSLHFLWDTEEIDCAKTISLLIENSINEDCPLQLHDGDTIKCRWNEKLDEYRSLRENSHAVLESYLLEEKNNTGIQNLKIRYNRMIGYFLEVSKGNLDHVPSHFIKRRSLANGDRYTTERLVELETELNGLRDSIIALEQELFYDIRKKISVHMLTFGKISQTISTLDVFQSFAYAATQFSWTPPVFCSEDTLNIEEARHPVVEAYLPSGEFIPNSIALSADTQSVIPSFALITGPNMAGKSTFLRQTALVVLMAQIGSFVPAKSMILSPIDKVFCRVGATDNLARGESTFFVEMSETAYILRNATERSLVIMDEVGRGTSTEDGLSIAHSVTEYLLDKIGSKTLFATHYHELSRFIHKKIAQFSLDSIEKDGIVVFRKKLKEGASENSFGIHVAKLAGIPSEVIVRAEEILIGIESQKSMSSIQVCNSNVKPKKEVISLFSEEEMVIDALLSTDCNSITPLEALSRIEKWKKILLNQ